MRYGILMAAALALGAGRAAGQALAQRVSGAGDGRVQFRFASRAGVCGDGYSTISGGDHNVMRGSWSGNDAEEWRRRCEPGPVRVVLRTAGGSVERLKVNIGGDDSGSDVHDVGTVSAHDAVAYLLDLARGSPNRVGDDAVLAAVLADSTTPWPSLIALARSAQSHETRESATFWLGQAAAARVSGTTLFNEHGERDESDDEAVRGEAIFAISQQPHDESVPVLIRVARTNKDPVLQKKALFWLGQSGDPRAIDLFSEILSGAER